MRPGAPAASATAAPLRAALPYLLAALSILLLAVMDSMIKAVVAHYPVVEVTALRFLCGLPWAIGLAWSARVRLPSAPVWRAHLLRGVLTVATGLQFFYALAVLPLAQAVALFFLTPLFIALFAALFLGEPIRLAMLAGVALGLGGMGIILSGQLGAAGLAGGSLPGAAAALGSAVTYALNAVLLRHRAQADPLALIVLLQNLVPFVLTAPLAALAWSWPTLAHWLLFLVAGLLAVAAAFGLTFAYARAPAGRVGVLEYTALVWAGLIGWWAFAETPTPETLAGAALIVLACLLGAWRRG